MGVIHSLLTVFIEKKEQLVRELWSNCGDCVRISITSIFSIQNCDKPCELIDSNEKL